MTKLVLVILSVIVLSNYSYAQSGEYIKDSSQGCLVLNDNGDGVTVTWTGACKDNYADGEGILTWFQNGELAAKYEGHMIKGISHGKGKYTFPGWGTMEGNFVDGVMQGQGRMDMENGGKLIGNFVDGNLLDLDAKYLSRLQKNDLGTKDTTAIYKGGNSNTLFYYALVPEGKVKGVLVLFPSTGEGVENVISCNKKLMQKCYDNNILTVAIASNYNKGLESDPNSMHFFNTVFTEVIAKYNAPSDKFILSGLSLGGENALQYTEISRSAKFDTSIKPLAAIGVDPPVDMANLYRGAKDEIAKYMRDSINITPAKQQALDEDNFLMDYFHSLYGGSPEEYPQKYIDGSQFSLDQADGGNAKYLLDVPVRIYTDPDILWQMKNKSRSYYNMNCADQSAMINFLQMNGNTRAEFIPALGKGYRLDGTRHPHSWSIVDADECTEWMLKLIN